MKIELANGRVFEGTLEEFKALKVSNPEYFKAPTVVKGDGKKSAFTETEKEKWNKGRIFGLIWSSVIAEEKLNSALNGKEDLSMFDRKEVKTILQASTQEKIQAKCIELGLDYDEYYKCYQYKKECDKKSK